MNRKIITLIFFIVFVLAFAKIILSAGLATTGANLAQLERERVKIAQENLNLEESIVELSSLARISIEANRLGFSKAGKIAALTPDLPIALHGLQ